jgi:HK97 family phage portal protein
MRSASPNCAAPSPKGRYMRNPFKREKALTGTSQVVAAMSTGWNPLPQLGSGSRQRIVEAFQTAKTANYSWMYARSPAVRSVIDVIVRNVGQLDLRLYEEISESERRPRPDHPAAYSMRYPSETVPSDQFIRTLFRDYLISADAVAIMLAASSNRLAFKWVPISRVQFLGSNMFDVDTYRIHDQLSGTYTDFPAASILHWRGEHPDDPRIGLSHLETLRSVIAEDAAMQQANVELANSGMAQQTWVYRPAEAPDWSNDDRRAMEEDLRNRIRRSNDMPVVLEEGMELRPMGISPKDAEALDLRKWIKGEVADEYGVPRGMVGLADKLEEARSQFYSDTLPPYCEEFTKMLNLRILVRAYGWTDGCFEFNLDEKLMGDDRLKALVSATGRPVMLTNEGRAKLNLPPVDGGDELVTPMNVIVGDNPQPTVDVLNPAEPNGQPRGVGVDQEPKALVKAQEFEPLPQLHPGRKAELDRQHRNIDRMQGVVQKHFNRLERSLGEKSRKGIQTKAADWVRWDKEFGSDLHNALERIVEAEGGI